MYAPFQNYVEIPPTPFSVDGADDYIESFTNQLVAATWPRSPVLAWVAYETYDTMTPFPTRGPGDPTCFGAQFRWYVHDNTTPKVVLVVDGLKGYAVCPDPNLVATIITGSTSIPATAEGVRQAVEILRGWTNYQVPATSPDFVPGHVVFRHLMPTNRNAAINPPTVDQTAGNPFLRTAQIVGNPPTGGGWIVRTQSPTGNPGHWVEVYIWTDPRGLGLTERCDFSRNFVASSSSSHPADTPLNVVARGSFGGSDLATHGLTKIFVNPYQAIAHIVDLSFTTEQFFMVSALHLRDLRRTLVDLNFMSEATFGAVVTPTGFPVGQYGFHKDPSMLGACLRSINGTILIDNGGTFGSDFGILTSRPYMALYGHPMVSPRIRWAEGATISTAAEFYEPWIGFNPFDKTKPGALHSFLWDCVLFTDPALVEGQEFPWDGETFKVYTPTRALPGGTNGYGIAFRRTN